MYGEDADRPLLTTYYLLPTTYYRPARAARVVGTLEVLGQVGVELRVGGDRLTGLDLRAPQPVEGRLVHDLAGDTHLVRVGVRVRVWVRVRPWVGTISWEIRTAARKPRQSSSSDM